MASPPSAPASGPGAGPSPVVVTPAVAMPIAAGRQRRWTSPGAVVALTVTVSLLATIAGYWAVRATAERAVEERFTAITTDVAAQVDRRLDAAESAVLAAQGLFAADAEVSSLDFFRFTDALAGGRSLSDRFPGIVALAAVDPDGRLIVSAPSHPTIRNTVHHVLELHELDQALLDASEQARPITSQFATDAAASDLVMATARYDDPLVNQLSSTPAERRAAVTGWSIALLEVDRLLDGVRPTGIPGIGARLVDDTGRQVGTTGSAQLAPVHERSVTLEHGDGTWTLEVVATRPISSPAERRLPGLVGLMGILLTAAAAGVLWLLTTQRERALAKVTRATAEVNRTNSELADANDRLREFAGVVAHDLRGPLTGIHGMVTALERRIGDDLEPLDAELLTRALRAAGYMDVLIGDVLRYAEAGVTPTDLRAMELAPVVAGLVEGLGPACRPEDTVEVDVEDAVLADPTGLRRVLGNLVGNALKYGREGGAVHVRVRSHQAGDRVVVEVADDGPGIPADQRDELVAPFRRGITSVDGSGLGLAICSRIIAHHGGTLQFDDSDLGGTLARFDLPVAP